MLLTRQQITALSGLSDDDVANCEHAGLITCTEEAGAEGFRHLELTKLHIDELSRLAPALHHLTEGLPEEDAVGR